MRKFGLIGFPLSHSFSKKYFTEKFEKEEVQRTSYQLFPLKSIEEFSKLLEENQELTGLNVTIPYKEQIIPYLDEIDPKAESIGAVNTIKIINGKKIGYNSDYYGFKSSLTKFFGANSIPKSALILGTGGASKAVKAVLKDLNINFQLVSRSSGSNKVSYQEILDSPNQLAASRLVINTTPLGMSPNYESIPELPYEQLTENHFLYDLVYNPLITPFMQKGIDANCWVKNGLEMLHGQAEKSWEIWNK
ncbi:shikimate dehydrogenase family protein [Roseivirga sp.]|uniref:shikimate dehydrogenase family protein n=1 Tax=Roseivirga sp. TaxID=1964215 RepID=UPI003B8B7C8E